MRILILDDDVRRHGAFAKALLGHSVVHVYDYHRCVAALERETFDMAYLDHDLNDFGKKSTMSGVYGMQHELTGHDVAIFIAGMAPDRRPKVVHVHSWNPDGAKRMVAALKEAGVECVYAPFESPKCVKCGLPFVDHTGNFRDVWVCPTWDAGTG
jgi:CheY-like chemotaxis protein